MKLKKILLIVLVIATVLLSSCSSKSKANLATLYNATADLTHDGENERLVRQIGGAEDGKAEIKIYTKKEDNNILIWKDSLGIAKGDQKGIYLCKKDGNQHIFIWKPTYNDDTTTLEYSVFYLDFNSITNKATPAEVMNDSITFTNEQVTKNGDKYEEASEFVYTLNKYISKSAAMIDTVGGEVVYSPSNKDIKTNPYYPDWYKKDYKVDKDSTSSTHSVTLSPDSSRIVSSTESSTEEENIELQDSKYGAEEYGNTVD